MTTTVTPRREHASPALAAATISSAGEPLDGTTRRRMESRFGFDFRNVRVHADAQAAASTRALGADAFAVGEHIAFAAGRFAPASPDGGRLLAHELAHVVQQRRGGAPPPFGHDTPHERYAEDAAAAWAAGARIVVSGATGVGLAGNFPKPPPGADPHTNHKYEVLQKLVEYRQNKLGNPDTPRGPRFESQYVFAVVEVWSANGEMMFTDYAAHLWRGDDHAEEQLVETLDSLLPRMKGLEGARVYVGVSQVPCPENCTPRLQEFANRTGVGLTVVTLTRPKINRPNEPASPKTTINTLGRPGVPDPLPMEMTEFTFEPRRGGPPEQGGPGGGGLGGGGLGGGGSGGGTLGRSASGFGLGNTPPAQQQPQDPQSALRNVVGQPEPLPETPTGGLRPGPGAAMFAGVQLMQGLTSIANGQQDAQARAEVTKLIPEIQRRLSAPVDPHSDPRDRPGGALIVVAFDEQSAPITLSGARTFLWADYVMGRSKGDALLKVQRELIVSHGGPYQPTVSQLNIPRLYYTWISVDGKSESWDLRLTYQPPPTSGKGGQCFIATACYGSATAPEVERLRRFRDRALRPRRSGRAFIACYYAASPPLARWLVRHPVLAAQVRTRLLDPIVARLPD